MCRAEAPKASLAHHQRLFVSSLAIYAAIAGLLLAVLLVARWVIANPYSDFDVKLAETIVHWDAPGLGPFFNTIAFLSDNWPALTLGIVGLGYLFITGSSKLAVAIGTSGLIVAAVSFAADLSLGVWVSRERPLEDTIGPSFPSGHAFGTTAFFGFALYIAFRYRLDWRFRAPFIVAAALLVGLSGLSRIYQEAHWPTDVIGGYLLGTATLLVLIRLFIWIEGKRWLSAPKLGRDIHLTARKRIRTTGSYASVVTLDSKTGTAIKVYDPPLIIRVLYWLAFQAKFPYSSNMHALESAFHRRRLAGLLTQYRFGKQLVAPIISVGCLAGQPSLVSRLIEGQEPPNDADARRFLTSVSQLFKNAGLPVWQLNPQNPHAHTNLVRTPEGDHMIIDLESAIVTPFPGRGQLRAALREGNFPAFDDIDFAQLRNFIEEREQDIRTRLGPEGLTELRVMATTTEAAVAAWKEDELRLVPKMIKGTYAALNLKQQISRLRINAARADELIEQFLSEGLDRWTRETRISPEQALRVREELQSRQAHLAVRHLGIHLAMSVPLRFPFGSVARFLWTVGLAANTLGRLVRTGDRAHLEALRIHNPVVMLVALIPGFGAFAYLLSKPLRRSILIRLSIDQVGRRLPFGIYRRSRLDRVVTPRSLDLNPRDARINNLTVQSDGSVSDNRGHSETCCSICSQASTSDSMECLCSPRRLAEFGLSETDTAHAA